MLHTNTVLLPEPPYQVRPCHDKGLLQFQLWLGTSEVQRDARDVDQQLPHAPLMRIPRGKYPRQDVPEQQRQGGEDARAHGRQEIGLRSIGSEHEVKDRMDRLSKCGIMRSLVPADQRHAPCQRLPDGLEAALIDDPLAHGRPQHPGLAAPVMTPKPACSAYSLTQPAARGEPGASSTVALSRPSSCLLVPLFLQWIQMAGLPFRSEKLETTRICSAVCKLPRQAFQASTEFFFNNARWLIPGRIA